MPSVHTILRQLGETLNQENTRLLQYFLTCPMDTSNLWYELSHEWDGWEAACEAVGTTPGDIEALSDADRTEEVYELCYKIDAWLDQNPHEKQEAAVALHQGAFASDAPSWSFFTLNSNKLLPPSTWLVHWSDRADEIVHRGFTHGTADVARLGLTTYTNNAAKKHGGYAFAFLAQSSEARNPDARYGKECVMFQSSGVSAFHSGDDEDQIIFWGPSITSRPIHIAQSDGGWEVRSPKGERVVRFDRVEKCFSWVMAHGQTYRRQLTPPAAAPQ